MKLKGGIYAGIRDLRRPLCTWRFLALVEKLKERTFREGLHIFSKVPPIVLLFDFNIKTRDALVVYY